MCKYMLIYFLRKKSKNLYPTEYPAKIYSYVNIVVNVAGSVTKVRYLRYGYVNIFIDVALNLLLIFKFKNP